MELPVVKACLAAILPARRSFVRDIQFHKLSKEMLSFFKWG
jgi:hypothetical protein